MPVSVNPKDSKLKITYSIGVDGTGKDITSSKTYLNIKPAATDEDVFMVASTLIDLQKNTAMNVERLDQKEIVEIV